MHNSSRPAALVVSSTMLISACVRPSNTTANFAPTRVIDLGALVTDSLPQQFWGRSTLKALNFSKQNSVELIKWSLPADGGSISGSNAYYTLFNHGGPHIDAPIHVGAGGGIDSYPVEAFSGPAKVFDVSGYPLGRSVPTSVFRGMVQPGDVVLIVTRYRFPRNDETPADVTTLTHDAAEYLATLPVRAYGTDAFGVESQSSKKMPWIHQTFLSRGIPIYEQLLNVDKLLGSSRLFFVGVPLNMKDGDGMLVRPVVFVY
jgi:arylformamidase